MHTENRMSLRREILNFLRKIFRMRIFESILAYFVKHNSSIFAKFIPLVPPNYMYKNNSIREVKRDGINFYLDISDYVEHRQFFNIYDPVKEYLYSLVSKDMVVMDIGTNIGDNLLHFAALTKGMVYGFEPDPKSYQKALKNISLNNFKNINLENIGLGIEKGSFELYEINESNRGMNMILDKPLANTPGVKIMVNSLDNYINERGIKKVGVLKIDTEGFEMNVIKGATEVLMRDKPVLFIELDNHNLEQQGSSAIKLVDFLTQLNYEVFLPFRKRMPEKYDFSNCHIDIVCFHKSK